MTATLEQDSRVAAKDLTPMFVKLKKMLAKVATLFHRRNRKTNWLSEVCISRQSC